MTHKALRAPLGAFQKFTEPQNIIRTMIRRNNRATTSTLQQMGFEVDCLSGSKLRDPSYGESKSKDRLHDG